MDATELEERLSFFDDWTERYQYIIAMGRKLPDFAESDKTETNRIQGCISQVWLTSDLKNTPASITFQGDSDSAIVRGLIFILLVLLSDKSPEDILATDVEAFFARIGLEQHLSPNRRNGFFSMVGEMRRTAAIVSREAEV